MIHGRIAGRQFRTAAQARTESRLLGFLGCLVKAAIDFLGRFNRANGAAVNIRGGHSHKKETIKAPIPGQEGLIKGSMRVPLAKLGEASLLASRLVRGCAASNGTTIQGFGVLFHEGNIPLAISSRSPFSDNEIFLFPWPKTASNPPGAG
jgi:hypothetical protein